MKKEVLIIFFIVIVIIIFDVVSQNYAQNFFGDISNDLSKVENTILKGDFDSKDLEKQIQDIQEKWKSKYNIFACFVEHEELEKVYTQIISANANIRVEEYNKSIEEIEKCKFILKHIQEKDSLNIVNIL